MSQLDKKIDDALKRLDEEPAIKFEYREEPGEKEDIFISLGDNMASNTWDDLMIQPLDLANLAPLLNTVNLSGSAGASTYNIAGGYSSTYNNSGIYTTQASPSLNWGSLNPSQVHITANGINMPSDADITIGGRSMKKMLEGIEQRLSILVPDPKKLEQFEALKQAYEHYKTLEALCNEEIKKE
ncbi:MAG: hypothetical protein EBU90_28680 [Proteobacteria bacterium]|nr:hypothetical protein [Pseudomonadota bacterium]